MMEKNFHPQVKKNKIVSFEIYEKKEVNLRGNLVFPIFFSHFAFTLPVFQRPRVGVTYREIKISAPSLPTWNKW